MYKKLLQLSLAVFGALLMKAQTTSSFQPIKKITTQNTEVKSKIISQEETRPQLKPLQVADIFDLNLSAKESYRNVKTGLVYQEQFQSEGAGFIKLYIENFDLKPGDYMEVYNPNTGDVFIYSEKGKVVGTKENPYMISEFWTGTIMGDHIIVSLFSKNANKSGHYGFDITQVSYGYSVEMIERIATRSPDDNTIFSICGADDKEAIVCYDGTEMYRKGEAVCRLLINGGGLCTGWLLGCEGNVMTNNHCIGTAAAANNTDFMFNYRYTTCGGTVDATSDIVATSSTFEYTDAGDDFTIVQLPVNPTATYGYLSLASVGASVGERIYIPQHPGGRRKEIAVVTDTDPDAGGFAQVANAGGTIGYNCDTEGGSSGSPVLRYNDNLVISIHCHGGCPNSSFGTSTEMIATLTAQGVMPACGVDDPNPAGPQISFQTASMDVNESTDCSFQDINVTVGILQGPSQNADVTFSVNGSSTATNGEDFQLMTSNVTFPAGSDTDQMMTVRVFNDAIIESAETIVVDFSVNANGGDAFPGNVDQVTLTILNDDYIAASAGSGQMPIFSDDFESGNLSSWTVTGAPTATDWAVTDNAGFPDAGFFNSDGSNTSQYAFVNDDDCNCDMSDERMMTPAIDLTAVGRASVNLDYAFSNTYGGVASIQLSIDGGATWPLAASLPSTGTGDESNIPFQNVTISLDDYVGQIVHLSVHFGDGGAWAGGFIVDNFVVQTPTHANVQTAVNAGTSSSFGVSGIGTSYAYDSASGDVMVSLVNNDTHDYGCTETSVTRAGTGGASYMGSIAPDLVADKTFYINPTTNALTGDVTVTLYFTEAEIAGWEASTSGTYTRSNLHILRDDSGPITLIPGNTINVVEDHPATVVTDAANGIVTVSATFNGLGGFVVGPFNALSIQDDVFNPANISLYPNPTNTDITIGLNNITDLPDSYEIYNVLGQRIMANEISSETDLTINTRALQTGVYFMKLTNDKASIVMRFVKQ